MGTRLERRVIAKAANYTITPPLDRAGAVFSNIGATGTTTFTLPTPNAAVLGWWYQFHRLAAQTLLVATAVADTLIAPGDLTADAASLNQDGASVTVICVRNASGGYSWAVQAALGTVTYLTA